jgi:hypothetical protein
VYLYGTTKRSTLGPADVWVAKAPFAQVTDPSAWEYHTGMVAPLDWSNDFTLAQPMTFTGTLDQNQDDIKAPLGQLSVTAYGTKYLAAASSDVLDTRIRAWIADNPEVRGNTSASSPPRSCSRDSSRTTPASRT